MNLNKTLDPIREEFHKGKLFKAEHRDTQYEAYAVQKPGSGAWRYLIDYKNSGTDGFVSLQHNSKFEDFLSALSTHAPLVNWSTEETESKES